MKNCDLHADVDNLSDCIHTESRSSPHLLLKKKRGSDDVALALECLWDTDVDGYDTDKERDEKLAASKKRRKSDDDECYSRNAPGHSWEATKRRREAYTNGTLGVDDEKLQRYKEEVAKVDENALIDPANVLRVRHSVCGKFIKMTDLY